MKKKQLKRPLALLLAVIMVIAMVPMTALAAVTIAVTPTMDVAAHETGVCDVVGKTDGALIYNESASAYDVAYEATLPMTDVWAKYTGLKRPDASKIGITGTFTVVINVDDKLIIDKSKLTQADAEKAFADATDNSDLMALFDISEPQVAGQAITVKATIKAGIKGEDLDKLEAASNLTDLKVKTPAGAITLPKNKFVAGETVTSAGSVSGTMTLEPYTSAPSDLMNLLSAVNPITVTTASPVAAAFGMVSAQPLLDIVPATKGNAFGTDYLTGHDVDNKIEYTGYAGGTITVPYSAALNVKPVFDLYDTVTSGGTKGDTIGLSGDMTLKFHYDTTYLAGPQEDTVAKVQAAFTKANAANSLASLYEVKDVSINKSTGNVEIKMSLKSGVTGADVKAAKAVSDTLYVDGIFTSQVLQTAWNGREVWVDNAAIDCSVTYQNTTLKFTSSTNSTKAPDKTASDKFILKVENVDASPLLDIVPAGIDNPYGTDYRTGYEVDNKITHSGTVGNSIHVPYSAALDVNSIFELYDTITGSGKKGDGINLTGDLTLSFDYDTNYLTGPVENTVALVQDAFDSANEDGTLASLYTVTNVDTSTAGKMKVTMTLNKGVTGADIKAAKEKSHVLKVAGTLDTKPLTMAMDNKAVWLTSGLMECNVTYKDVTLHFNSTTDDVNKKTTIANGEENATPTLAADKFILSVSGGSGGPGGNTTTYTLTYMDGTNRLKYESYNKDASVDLTYKPANKTVDGKEYQFVEWYSDAELTKPVSSVTMSSDQTVYAKWEEVGDGKHDLTTKHYAYIIGYPDNMVRPEKYVTRAETATIFLRLLNDTARANYWKQTNNFSDVQLTNWFNNAVSTIANRGVINGYPNGTYMPNGNITRAELAKIIVSFTDPNPSYSGANKFSDINGHWASAYINVAAEKGYLTGYANGTFLPDEPIKRSETATMINRFLGRDTIKPDHMLTGMKTWSDNNDPAAWYYNAIQEATNSHEYEMKTPAAGNKYEEWTAMKIDPNWKLLETPTSKPTDVTIG